MHNDSFHNNQWFVCAVNRCVAAELQLFMLFCYRRPRLFRRLCFCIRSGGAHKIKSNSTKAKHTLNNIKSNNKYWWIQLRFISKNVERLITIRTQKEVKHDTAAPHIQLIKICQYISARNALQSRRQRKTKTFHRQIRWIVCVPSFYCVCTVCIY